MANLIDIALAKVRSAAQSLGKGVSDFASGVYEAVKTAEEPLVRGLAALDPYTRRMYQQADQQRLQAAQNLINYASKQTDIKKKKDLLKLASQISSVAPSYEYAQTLPQNKEVLTSGLKTAGMALSGGIGTGGFLGTAALSTGLSALGGKENVGYRAGRSFGEVLPYLGATKITTPLISAGLRKFAPNIPRLAQIGTQGLANVAEGAALSKSFGQSYTPSQAAIDLVMGGLARPFSGSTRMYSTQNPKIQELWNHINTLQKKKVNLIEQGGSKVAIRNIEKAIKKAQDEVWRLYQEEKAMGFTSSQTSKAAGLPKAGKSQTPELSTSKVSQTSASEPIIVKTKKQLNKVLEQNPQAEVKIGGGGKGDAPDPEDVAKTIEARINNFTKRVLGYSQEDIKPEGAGVVAKIEGGVLKLQKPYTKAVIKLQQKATSAIERGLASESAPIRLASQLIEGLFRGAGMSPARAEASRALGGEIATAQWRNYNIGQQLLDLIGMDSKSLERVNAVLDPALAKQKIKFSDLTPEEKQLYGLIREGLDLVHDISYSNGFISKELYLANKGKYTPRLYEPKELPPEVNDMVNQMLKKINLDIFKKRKDIDAWKIENSLNNPVYGLVKRLTQVQINSAVKKYTDFLASQKHLISDTPRIGFTQLSDSPAYGALAGKYVLNSAAEDLKGFFFANEGLNKLYDVFRIYDGLPPRQLIKKLLTVFNPTTNVGNIVSDNVFGFLVGVNPYTLNKNILLLKQDPKQYKAITEYLMRKGIVATDITRTDFVNDLAKIDDLADIGKKTVKTKSIGRRVGEFYAGTDDVYKAAAFKALIDRGLSFEEAAQRVFDGFQNYKNVGKFYDVFAKTPIIGEPFIKFQGDLIRIIKNAAVNNPLGLITFLGTLKITADLFSKISGETPEDRKTREERFAAPYIPILNIPLTWQTPIGEINVARYISPFFANRETSSVASKMLPFIPQTGQKDVASFIAQNAGDPMTAPIVQALVDRDFRGKPIADKNETKYKPSTLTPEERMLNRATFLARGYTPPFINSVIDVVRASQGKENMYGAKQTTAQALARMAGVKIQQFGPKEAEEYRQKEQEFQSYKNEDIDKRINSIYKQLLKGEITQEQADKRIKELEKQKVSLGETKSTDKIVRYIDENDQLKKIDIGKVLDMPATTETEMALKIDKAYKLLGQIEDIPKKEEQDKALQMLGVPRDKAEYYWVASKDTDVKYAYVIDQINNKSGEEALSTLVKLRQEYNNRSILTNKVIDQLVDNEVISSELGSYLKKIEFSGGKIKVTGRPKKISIKKIQTSLPAKIKVQKVDIKSMSKLLKLKKAKRIKIKAKKIGYK